MLNPYERHHLFAALRPPDGYQLDQAIGTTFSLDLLTLLTLPLSFTFFADPGEQGDLIQDPLLLLDGVRRYAQRMVIFCQAGQIAVPQASQQLFTYLEESVFEVAPPHHEEGVFHPKVWLLRYTPLGDETTAADGPVRYRFICLSRNLTFDRSWDTILTLDGELTKRQYAYGRNHPLGDFFAALPGMMVRPASLPETAAAIVDKLQDEVRRVDFELPLGFKELTFLPLGLSADQSWPFGASYSRQLVVSPFVAAGFLQQFGQQSGRNVLLSRLDSLGALTTNQLQTYDPIYVLNTDATPEPEDESDTPDDATEGVPVTDEGREPGQVLSGLHAKVFIAEHGWDATVWTGSANATNAAFQRNVEFMVQMTGKKSQVGINKFLATDDRGNVGFMDLLMPYTPQEEAADVDPVAQELEAAATTIRRQLARLPLEATLTRLDETPDQERYRLVVSAEESPGVTLPVQATVHIWPITLSPETAVTADLAGKETAVFGSLSFAALTPFFGFKVVVRNGREQFTSRFVVTIPILNPPAERQERILRQLLDSREKVLRYLLFLLAEGEENLTTIAGLLHQPRGENGASGLFKLGGTLFESLVKALHQQPDRLDHIHHLVADLRKAGNADLLPDGFDAIWEPIWEAHTQLSVQRPEREEKS